MYLSGRAVPLDEAQATVWLEKAAGKVRILLSALSSLCDAYLF